MSCCDLSIKLADGIHLREAGGEGILYDTAKKKVHFLNSTATLIWRLCSESHGVAEISDILSERYGVALDVVKRDVEEMLRSLADLQLLELVPADASARVLP